MNEGERASSLGVLGFVCVKRLLSSYQFQLGLGVTGLGLPDLVDIKFGCFSDLLIRSFHDIFLLFLKDCIGLA